jgi:cell division septal protein FtsQ
MLPSGINFKKKSRFRKKGKLSYGSNKYLNPFFSKKKKNKQNNLFSENTVKKIRISIIAGITIIAASIWFLLFSNYFTINNVKANGGSRIQPEIIEKFVWQQIKDSFIVFLPQKNIFIFSKNRLIKSLEEKYSFNELKVKKDFPNSIIIDYNEKQYVLIWNEGDKYYYCDEKAYVIAEANLLEIKQKDYPIIKNNTDKQISDNNLPIGIEYINYTLALFEKFKNSNEFRIDKFIVDNDVDTVKAVILDGPSVYFDIKENLEKQFNKLIIVKKEKIKDDFNSKSYIDVRIGDSVYYR